MSYYRWCFEYSCMYFIKVYLYINTLEGILNIAITLLFTFIILAWEPSSAKVINTNISILAWEPSSAKVTTGLGSQATIDIFVLPRRCITPAVYPHLNDLKKIFISLNRNHFFLFLIMFQLLLLAFFAFNFMRSINFSPRTKLFL